MWCLYPHAGDIVRTQMARGFFGELFNGGYIRTLQTLATESGARNVSFAREYANGYGVSIGAALLFGPKGAEVGGTSAATTVEVKARPPSCWYSGGMSWSCTDPAVMSSLSICMTFPFFKLARVKCLKCHDLATDCKSISLGKSRL